MKPGRAFAWMDGSSSCALTYKSAWINNGLLKRWQVEQDYRCRIFPRYFGLLSELRQAGT